MEIKEHQEKDTKIDFLRKYLFDNDDQIESRFLLSEPQEKCYYQERDQFKIHSKGVICRLPKESDEPIRLFVPDFLREGVMCLEHDLPSSGNQGFHRTKELKRRGFYWWRMTSDVRSYVFSCGVCAKNKTEPLPNRTDLKS